jgi:hypothetical protein
MDRAEPYDQGEPIHERDELIERCAIHQIDDAMDQVAIALAQWRFHRDCPIITTVNRQQ